MELVKDEIIFWGKYLEDGPRSLPLAAHCLDVAIIFRSLCDLPTVFRALCKAASVTSLEEQQLDRLAILAMLHDIGKANLGFQLKVFDDRAPQAGHVRELEPLFDFEDEGLHHSLLQSLPASLDQWFSSGEVAYSYFIASFSHHGRPLSFQGDKGGTYWQARKYWWRAKRMWDPFEAIAEVTRWAKVAFPKAFEPGGPSLPEAPPFHHRFAGLLMLADWLGSHPDWFPIEKVTVTDRLHHCRIAVPKFLRTVGLDVSELRPILSAGPKNFADRFRFAPRPLQVTIDSLNPADPNTRLVIAESETGSGKTEAALNWFYKLFEAGEVDSLYFALPTRVAARELYHRVQEIVERWFPDPGKRPVTVLAVPGYSMPKELARQSILPTGDVANRWQDDSDLVRRDRYWAAERPKRFLAATVAIGTIDQALLSSVRTAHAHLRSVCLDRSLLVVDEVHASDVYMSRLLESLLGHHLSVGGSAMLLSATLGASARNRYTSVNKAEACSLLDLDAAKSVPYPAITLLDNVSRACGISHDHKHVKFEMISSAFELESVVPTVKEALQSRARILVVLNTVDRANKFLQLIESHPDIDTKWFFQCNGTISPHHGRFSPADRLVLDRSVSDSLGRHSKSGPLILVGTQTLEQSLDIDADLLISDLAPADVLLQRVGRLHRHKRDRPEGYEQPRCIVLIPEGDLENGLDHRGYAIGDYMRIGYGSVYEDLRTLELTRRTLTQRPDVFIPQDNRSLVEAVTHPDSLADLRGELWEKHAQYIDGSDLARAIAASHAKIIFDEYFGQFVFNEAGEKVMTRLGGGSLQLPVDRPFRSPFGQRVDTMIIPSHMAPAQPDEAISVLDTQDGTIRLRCGERTYRYSRYGLEGEAR